MSTPKQVPEFFSLQDKYGVCRPVGEMTLDRAVAAVDDALHYCSKNKIRGLLVNVSGTSGFPSPSLTDRFWYVTKWAETARGRVVLSMVAPPFMILPDKMGVTFAANRGLQSEVFLDEDEAAQWLCSVCKL